MAEVSITQRQLNEIAKGRPIQVSFSGLTSQTPNTHIGGLGMDAQKRIRRAINERRGMRLKLTPDEIASIKTTLNGGSFGMGIWDWADPKKNGIAKAFDPKQNGVAKAFAPVAKVITKDIPHAFRRGGEAEQFGKQVGKTLKPFARPAVKYLANAGVDALLTMSGNPEFAPFATPLVNYGVDKALDKANLGFGMKLKKGSPEMKARMAQIRGMRKSSSGGAMVGYDGHGQRARTMGEGILDEKFSINDVGRTAKDLFGRGTPILDQKFSINDVKHFANNDLKKLFGKGTPILDQKFSINDVKHFANNDLKKLFGYGVKPAVLKSLKDEMRDFLAPHVKSGSHAIKLANKVFKHGTDILDLPEIKITGGKINWGKIGSTLKKGATDIWHRAKPVLKHFGKEAISYAKPMVSDALKGVAETYGIDPALADIATNMVVSQGEKYANQGLNKITKQEAQTPQQAQQKLIGDAQHYGRTQSDVVRQKGHELITKYVPPQAQEYARAKLEEKHKNTTDDLFGGSFRGYGMRDDFGSLLNMSHPATTPFMPPPNLPQGQVSGGSFGGYGSHKMCGCSHKSMCGCGTPILDQKFSINDVKHFANNDLKKLFGGRVRLGGRSNMSSEGGSFYGGSFQ